MSFLSRRKEYGIKQVDDALSLAKTGENTETEFFVINTSGVWIYNKLQFKKPTLTI